MNEVSKKSYAKLYKRLISAKSSLEFYETHQLYKTLFNRLNNNDNVESENLLNEGATFLLANDQSESGADLVMMLLKFYIDKKWTPTDNIIIKLKNYFSLMKKYSNERKNTIIFCHKWLSNDSKYSDLFNNWIAVVLWKEENYADARYHFMLCGNGVHTAKFLLNFHLSKGYKSERDLFIIQAVLQYLCLEKFASASMTFYVYVNNHPDLENGPPFNNYPLLNFAWFLMLAIELKLNKSVFTKLCDQYSKHLLRDPVYSDYLTRIGQIYFQISPQKNPDSFLSNIMNMLVGTSGSGEDTLDNGRLLAELDFTSEEMD